MLKLRTISIQLTLLLFAAVILSAQNAVATLSAGSQSNSQGLGASAGTSQQGGVIVAFAGSSASSGNTLQPLSADVTDEIDRVLADGTHIHHESHGKMFRDSQGRQRTEIEMDALGADNKPLKLIRITDPVEKEFILLDVENKIARVSHFGQPPSNPGNDQKQVKPDASRVESPDVPSPNRAATAPLQRSFEKLGIKEIEGFSATGTRYTTTTPVGAVGNDKPLTTTSEHWSVQDLSLQVLSSVDDPRSGKRVYRLTNIQMGDPDPLLFQIPADFTVKDMRQQ